MNTNTLLRSCVCYVSVEIATVFNHLCLVEQNEKCEFVIRICMPDVWTRFTSLKLKRMLNDIGSKNERCQTNLDNQLFHRFKKKYHLMLTTT